MLKDDNINEILIDSVAKYINEIDKLPPNSFFRGEDKNYFMQTSSALRTYTGGWKSKKPFPFIKMLDEFYKETAYKLNEDKSGFIAFAQHYGIPTNLLDISTSPLTALYFACQGIETEEGYVYVIDKACIDITELIHKYPNKNLINELFSNTDTPEKLNQLIPLFVNFKKLYPEKFYYLLSILIEEYLYYFKDPFDNEEKEFQSILQKEKDFLKNEHYDTSNIIWELPNLIDSFNKFKFEYYDCVSIYLCLQYLFFKHAKDYTVVIHNINFLPNMIYNPAIKFERGRGQQGLFIYQGYINYIESDYNYYVLAKQRICFNDTIYKINNKKEILSTLDKIGINRKTLFCDFDNIAAYIKDKYMEK